MSHLKIVTEGSRDLLHDLNTATAKMLSFAIGQVGSTEWQIARLRQEEAFAKWHRYISKEPAVKSKEREGYLDHRRCGVTRLSEVCVFGTA